MLGFGGSVLCVDRSRRRGLPPLCAGLLLSTALFVCQQLECWVVTRVWCTLTGLALQVLGGVLHASFSATVVKILFEVRGV